MRNEILIDFRMVAVIGSRVRLVALPVRLMPANRRERSGVLAVGSGNL